MGGEKGVKSPLGTLFQGISRASSRPMQDKAPVPYVASPDGLQYDTGKPSERLLKPMGQVGTLFAIVTRTSTAASQVCWKMYRTQRNGDKGERVEVSDHLALRIWNKPNPFMTQQELVEIGQQHMDLVGETWLTVVSAGGSSMPQELWPLRPDRMDIVPSREDFIAGYIYRAPNGTVVPLERSQVLFQRAPNPCDPYRGMGAVQTILADLDSNRLSAEWNRNFFLNGAEPGGLIKIPVSLSDEDFRQLQYRWNEQHKGVANAHRIGILEGDAEWVERKLSQKDMQFVELRAVSTDVIRGAYGIPKFAVGDVDDVNRASADASAAWFAQYLTVPRLERWKQMLNNDFLPLFGTTGQGVEFDYESPVPADRDADNAELTAKVSAYSTLISAGVDPEDAAATCGLPPMRLKTPDPVPEQLVGAAA